MTKNDKDLSIKISNMGNVGWFSGKIGGYRYQAYYPDRE